MSCAAVVVNYESGLTLRECVRALRADSSAGTTEIVVVDNGSRDGSAAVVSQEFPEVTIIEPGRNLGYARAANLGIAATRAPIVAVLNPDTIVAAGTAAAMRAVLDADPNVAAVGPRIRNPDGSTYPSARRVPGVLDAIGHGLLGLVHPTNRFTRRYRELDADPARPRLVDWCSGAAIFLRRSALDAIGGWDERYFMYVEDVDLCWRLRRAGWRVRYDPSATVVHVQGVSTDRHPYRMIVEHHRSLYRFAAKRWRGLQRLALAPAALYLAARAALACIARAVPRRRALRPRMRTGD